MSLTNFLLISIVLFLFVIYRKLDSFISRFTISADFKEEKEGKDELFDKAVKLIAEYDRVSASLLQRRLIIGYARAYRLLEQLTKEGYVSEAEGSLPRRILKKVQIKQNYEKSL